MFGRKKKDSNDEVRARAKKKLDEFAPAGDAYGGLVPEGLAAELTDLTVESPGRAAAAGMAIVIAATLRDELGQAIGANDAPVGPNGAAIDSVVSGIASAVATTAVTMPRVTDKIIKSIIYGLSAAHDQSPKAIVEAIATNAPDDDDWERMKEESVAAGGHDPAHLRDIIRGKLPPSPEKRGGDSKIISKDEADELERLFEAPPAPDVDASDA
jgi:hypothetical protein